MKHIAIRCSTYIAALFLSAHLLAADAEKPKEPAESKLSAGALMQHLDDAKSSNPKARDTACKALMADGEKSRKALVRTLSNECKMLLNTVQARTKTLQAGLKSSDVTRKEIKAKRAAALKMIYDSKLDKDKEAQQNIRKLCEEIERLVKMAEYRKLVRNVAEANHKEGAKMNASERRYIELLNDYRIMMGRKPLLANRALNAAARKHSREMQTMTYFSHTSPVKENRTFGKRAAREGYRGARGENIFKSSTAAEAVLNAWRNSPPHRRNLLDAGHSDTGIGMAGNIWTNVFGKSR